MIVLTTLTSLLQLQNLVAAVLTSASDSLSFSETLMRRVVMILVIMINTKWSSPTGHWPHICWTKVKYYCHCHHHHHHHYHHQVLFVLHCRGVLFVGQGCPVSCNKIYRCACIQKLCMNCICFCLTPRRLMSYIYGAPILDVSRSHTTTQHSR